MPFSAACGTGNSTASAGSDRIGGPGRTQPRPNSGRFSSSGWRRSQVVPSRASRRRRAMPDKASSATRLARKEVISAWSYGGDTSTTSIPSIGQLRLAGGRTPAVGTAQVEQLAGGQPARLGRAGSRRATAGRRRRRRRTRKMPSQLVHRECRTPRPGHSCRPRAADLGRQFVGRACVLARHPGAAVSGRAEPGQAAHGRSGQESGRAAADALPKLCNFGKREICRLFRK